MFSKNLQRFSVVSLAVHTVLFHMSSRSSLQLQALKGLGPVVWKCLFHVSCSNNDIMM